MTAHRGTTSTAMADTDIVWPVGTTDRDPALSSRALVFSPRGFLVAILPDADGAERAAAALRAAGFADRGLRTFTGRQILDDYARYTAQQSLPRRVVAALTDDEGTRHPLPRVRPRRPLRPVGARR